VGSVGSVSSIQYIVYRREYLISSNVVNEWMSVVCVLQIYIISSNVVNEWMSVVCVTDININICSIELK